MIAFGARDNMKCLCRESERRREQNAIGGGAATWAGSRLQAKFELTGTSNVLLLLNRRSLLRCGGEDVSLVSISCKQASLTFRSPLFHGLGALPPWCEMNAHMLV